MSTEQTAARYDYQEARVSYTTGTATVTWNASVVTFHEIKAAIEQLDYQVLERPAQDVVRYRPYHLGALYRHVRRD